jgi:DNA polymerase-3 subunit gamma/tau
MAYKALYRTYRPSTFEEVVGQQHIVLTLQNAIKNHKIAHAYLFCGPRGTGKTTVAKLVSKGVNCISEGIIPCNICHNCISIASGSHPDIVEIDAASNNGVDEIRDLIEKVKYSPIESKYKVYIIDEVHMLSTGAFNALLKTLEEPPAHVIFILATTEPHKVLPTVISRCQRFDFTKVPLKLISERIEYILDIENVKYEKEVVRLISNLAEGGLRDALSILEQIMAYAKNDLKEEHVYQIYGISTIKEKIDLLDAIFSTDAKNLLDQFDQIEKKSHDIKRLTGDLVEILKESVIYSYTQDEIALNLLTSEEAKHLLEQRNHNELLAMIDILIDTFEKYRNATNVQAYFEVALLKMMSLDNERLVYTQTATKKVKAKKVEKVDKVDKAETEDHIGVKPQEKAVEVEPIQQEVIKQEKPIEKPQEQTEIKRKPLIKEENSERPQLILDVRNYNTEELIQCMVAADKEMRHEDTEQWGKVEDFVHELEWAKIARYLIQSEVAISGEKFIVVIVASQEAADLINDPINDPEFKKMMKLILGKSKHVIAIDKRAFDTALAEFLDRRSKNNLPEPIHIEEEKIEVKKTTEQVAIDLFGQAFVEVSEE